MAPTRQSDIDDAVMQPDEHLETSWWALRLAYGIVPIVAGLDKFVNLLVDWQTYLSPLAEQWLPVTPDTFMLLVGLIEIAAGILVLSRFTRLGAYIVSAWLVAIAINLVTTGTYFDIAVRDLVMAIGAFVLGKLTAVRELASAPRLRPKASGATVTVAGGAVHPRSSG